MLTCCQLICLTLMSYCFCFVWVFFNTEPNEMPSHVSIRYSSREAKRSSRPCFANFFGQTTSCRDSAAQLMLFKSQGVFNASLPGSQAQFHFIGVLYTSMQKIQKSARQEAPMNRIYRRDYVFSFKRLPKKLPGVCNFCLCYPLFFKSRTYKGMCVWLSLCFYIKKKKSKETRATGPLHILNYNITVQLWCWHGCNTF